jgi:hypothetical protein
LNNLAPGTHSILASYGGDMAFSPSVSAASSLIVSPETIDGPRVVSIQRDGYHAMPTRLVIDFNDALDPTSAQDPHNYRITGPGKKVIRVVAASYNQANHTVTLDPARRLDLHKRYTLTVFGTGPGGVKDASGQRLDGTNSGLPGSNYSVMVDAADLVVTNRHARGEAAALKLAARVHAADARALSRRLPGPDSGGRDKKPRRLAPAKRVTTSHPSHPHPAQRLNHGAAPEERGTRPIVAARHSDLKVRLAGQK